MRHWVHRPKDSGILYNDTKFVSVLAPRTQTEYLRNNICRYVSSHLPLIILLPSPLHHPKRFPREIWFAMITVGPGGLIAFWHHIGHGLTPYLWRAVWVELSSAGWESCNAPGGDAPGSGQRINIFSKGLYIFRKIRKKAFSFYRFINRPRNRGK